jgi:Xaa-Pro aminopeptidase
MAFDLAAIQAELRGADFDGWLFYDYLQRDPMGYRVLGLKPAMVKRRWFYFVPAAGEPRKLVHRVEPRVLDALPGAKQEFSTWGELRAKLGELLAGAKRVAMQYSPDCHIPIVSVVDAGTVELVRGLGKEVVSSAGLVQIFEARWTREQREMHFAAGKVVDEIMAGAFRHIGEEIRARRTPTEYSVQQWIVEEFGGRGLESDDPPIVGVNENSGDPHYEPQAADSRPIRRGDWVLLDVWAKLKRPGAVYYDITWMGIVGAEPSARQREVFEAVRAARDAAVAFVSKSVAGGERLCGFQVDDVARGVLRECGLADFFVHRTGHSIGEDVHWSGANMDNFETHDEREIIPGTCFSVEPGVYLPEFGVRLEVDVYVDEKSAGPTGAVQTDVVRIEA